MTVTEARASEMPGQGATPCANSDRESAESAYLQILKDLAREMEAAMAAISCSSLSDFEESVGRQERLCGRLTAMANRGVNGDTSASKRDRQSGPPTKACEDGSLELRVQAARGTLLNLNQSYDALLRHSSRSINLLNSLCKSYSGQINPGQIKEARGTGSKHQTWYCEV